MSGGRVGWASATASVSLFEPEPFTASVSAPILSAFVAQVFSSPATLSRYLAPSKAPWISMPSIDETLQYECSAPVNEKGAPPVFLTAKFVASRSPFSVTVYVATNDSSHIPLLRARAREVERERERARRVGGMRGGHEMAAALLGAERVRAAPHTCSPTA